ncbi:MAG: hypothetical protein LBE92_03480 [Chryseobacterium sp.]|jgi:tetratricopeptide (TPR) repeat protein|uniref:hypothetical protein n=1 Tax=Chryseobacterium sp. TaxID=1871047 RepID=UPI00282FAEC6|nr:hypothetical protein [Chryseobacterium sp.]MDR2235162.1 hypothetical protein [Chryseobacterium sp.]
MKYFWVLSFMVAGVLVHAQQKYSAMAQKAADLMENTKDGADYKEALSIYEQAFTLYPDSISGPDLYNVSVMASELKDYDKAFKYLTSLVKIKATEDHHPGWGYIEDESSESDYKNLLSDPRWKALKQSTVQDKKEFYQVLQKNREEFFRTRDVSFNGKENLKTLYTQIKNNQPFLPKAMRNYSVSFTINDSATTSYLVHLPKDYQPQKKYPLLFFLHGAVRYSTLADYLIPQENLGTWNRFYTKYADLNEVILVFPRASKAYNWMTSDDGFFMVPDILKQIKTTINVDDNRVFISGHSNGATGSFSYLMKQPSSFAGFYGFNTYPKVFTGGTFVENIKNRSFINFSTDQDYYYPPNANDDMTGLMKGIKADYKEYRYNGFPHWFPMFKESESGCEIIFNDLKKRKRNPFPKEISWEFDDERYGSIDWLSGMKLDTLQSRAAWHQNLNFKITKWLKYNDSDSLITEKTDKNAFDFPRKSGKIKAAYAKNIFRIETSDIRSFSISISPEMVDLKKKVKVFVNGKLYFNQKVKYDRDFMLQSFENNRDREQIWINTIHLKV